MGARDDFGANEARFVDDLWARFFAPKVILPVDEWADAHRVLPPGSAEPGPWRTDRSPYARQIYRDLSDDSPYEDVVLMCATQLVKSETGLNWIGSIIDQTPGPILIVQPTVGLAEAYSKQRIAAMIRSSPTLAGKVKDARARDSGNTVLLKEFPGGMLKLAGAESAAGLASMPARFVHFDERDDYPDDCEGQGEPTKVARARQDTYRRRKRLTSSSPKRPKGLSRIEQEFEAGTRFRYHVPCPHCDELQTLTWAGIKWSKDPDDASTAAYVCKHCAAFIEEHHKPEMLARGEWIADNPGARVRSYHLSSLYSPYGWLSWSTLVEEWLEAMALRDAGDPQPLKTFLNTRLAETWEEQAEKIAAHDLRGAAEDIEVGVAPAGVIRVVASVDVQDDRLEIAFWGFGDRDQMWFFDYVVLRGDPGKSETWGQLDVVLQTRVPHELGVTVPISATAIDTGGHFTHEVYRFVRGIPAWRRVSAIKGGNKPGMPIYSGKPSSVDVNTLGGVVKGGVKLWHVGVNTAKDLFYARLKRPGQVHLAAGLPDEVFEQLTAEHRVKAKTSTGTRFVWKQRKAGGRNEAWDLGVYAIWCAERLGISKWPRAVWEAERAKLMNEDIAAAAPVVRPLQTTNADVPMADSLPSDPKPELVVSPVTANVATVTVATHRASLVRPLRTTGGED